MLKHYLQSISEHALQCAEQLDELKKILPSRSWSKIEQSAAERQLQVLAEACIGVAKHWLKQLDKVVPSDAYGVFTKLNQLGELTDTELLQWRKIIGMRNALVHDYLNFSPTVLHSIIGQQQYQLLLDFIVKAKVRWG
ncbi:type VII toxin-antitoxin system HepT family RNase toxin [Rheinheimera sp.]|uniref:type VII toxin-antitoxin system HepT family RNase toxin n=1 Tax=Rheinheimera sp. TaxID=1869214 RepID=UPI004048CF8B